MPSCHQHYVGRLLAYVLRLGLRLFARMASRKSDPSIGSTLARTTDWMSEGLEMGQASHLSIFIFMLKCED